MYIEQIFTLPVDIETLLVESQSEGFRFLERLVADFREGSNCFDATGEILFAVREQEQLIAVGGLNAYHGVGRLRRFYVAKAHRRTGVGRQLLTQLEQHAAKHFAEVVLFTGTVKASRFYETCGYTPVQEYRISHRKRLA